MPAYILTKKFPPYSGVFVLQARLNEKGVFFWQLKQLLILFYCLGVAGFSVMRNVDPIGCQTKYTIAE